MDTSGADDDRTPLASSSAALDAKPPKRQMKSPFQLEVLENTYAMETYPSEALRAELSARIGLTDRQLQMWFCHRRLKDRRPPKRQRLDEPSQLPPPPPAPAPPQMHLPAAEIGASSTGSMHYTSETLPPPRKAVARMTTVAVPRMAPEIPPQVVGNRYYEPPMAAMMQPAPVVHQLTMGEMRVIASVEQQLGEPLRDDGPILGVEFDPLPPGSFGAPIAMPSQPKHPMRPYESKIFERHDGKPVKVSTYLPNTDHSFISSSSTGKRKRAVGSHGVHPHLRSRSFHEYQFLPEQPSIHSETYERASDSHFYDTSMDLPISRASPLPPGAQFSRVHEQPSPSYGFQSQVPSSTLLAQPGRQQTFSSGSAEYENVVHSNSYGNNATDTHFGVHQIVGMDNPHMGPDRRIIVDEDASRMDKKRKTEEARIAKEVEAHEKRIRKELAKQDILRRKREEQMKKEMERHDRERRKEEERLVREKQKEEERFLREQRRENERKEKFLQKESLRAEKRRQKEETRREKEAAKQKAANERATARRLAREYMELVEDERLELMELAASSKGLQSTISLDSDTLDQLDSFRGKLRPFPPKSVKLRRLFAIPPWSNSEESTGNLLMVWKFLITFADVLELWPFTLDEFVQALHDYDSRLLGEVHVALLKSIIKDVVDVAKAPVVLGGNQSSVINPGGGHPQIVEGAYAWGCNIHSWHHHINFLTWPEILRQFALSAGFGPRLKKKNADQAYFRDANEGNDGEDVISTLRSGVAAENAASLMRERGYTHRRRSRHRLTPGTVKFAAFHVLSLEDGNGLTILEVADKIQKSGLRDLTTSKTPEASIAAALSRDTKLFERTAPSTYCVRSPYRKDPANADTIMSAAREKIQVFQQNNLSDSEAEKDTEDADEAERDEDSDCEGADDPESDEVGIEAKVNENTHPSNELSGDGASKTLMHETLGSFHGDRVATPQIIRIKNIEKCPPLPPLCNTKSIISNNIKDEPFDISSPCHEDINADQEDTEIDESDLGEPWIQGLAEGEYSDLSVEERLNALVALIGVAIEGNSIRITLEERLEAANALKKQMWAEAQLDKRRLREEYTNKSQYSSCTGARADQTQMAGVMEGCETPVNGSDCKLNDMNQNDDQFLDQQILNNLNGSSIEKSLTGQEMVNNNDAIQQCGYAAEKSRAQLKSYIGHKAEEIYVYRSLPIGQDRRRNRYWLFATSSSPNDPGSGRILFESRDGYWRVIDSEEAFDALLTALDTRGIRESHLHSMLQRIEPTFKESIRRNKNFASSASPVVEIIKKEAFDIMSSPSSNREFGSPSSTVCDHISDASEYSPSFRIDCGLSGLHKNSALKRFQGFVKWIWKESFNPFVLCAMKYGKKRCNELLQTCQVCFLSYLSEERHCPSCHKTFKIFHQGDANFSEHVMLCEERRKVDPDWKIQVPESTLPIRNRLLKSQLSLLEVSLPAEALQPFWTNGYRKSWGEKLQSSSSAEEIFQVLTLLESAIKKESLSANFETTNELLTIGNPGFSSDGSAALSGSVPVLPWIPNSTAAIALRLFDLDSSISYILHQKSESHKDREAGDFLKFPSRYTVVKNIPEFEVLGTTEQFDCLPEARCFDSGVGRRGRGRGSRGRSGRGRGRGGRGQRGGMLSSFREHFKDGPSSNIEKTRRKNTRGGRSRGRGRRRGRSRFRPHQISESSMPVMKEPQSNSFNGMHNIGKHFSTGDSPRSLDEDEWNLEGRMRSYGEDGHCEESEYDDQDQASADQDQLSGDEYEMVGYGIDRQSGSVRESDEEDELEEDEDDIDNDIGYQVAHEDMDEDEDEEDDDDDEDEIDGEDGDEGDGMAIEDEEDSTASFSSSFSD